MPAEIPVTVPLASMVAIPGLLVLHVPPLPKMPPVLSVIVPVAPIHIVPGPIMVPTDVALTVSIIDTSQPPVEL